VAIVPKGAKLDTVTESTDAVIMRAADAAAALELRKRLTASANQMSAVAGLLDVSYYCNPPCLGLLCCACCALSAEPLNMGCSVDLLKTATAFAERAVVPC
jgi:hypothetical protein